MINFNNVSNNVGVSKNEDDYCVSYGKTNIDSYTESGNESIIDYPSFILYNNEKKGENNMSLVGLFKCGNGIVGFGDYKSTKRLNFFVKEEENRETKKVFKNNKFIFVTFGFNEILVNNNKTRLEDYISSNLKEDTNCDEFFNGLANYTSSSNIIYNFLVGKKGEDGFYFIYDVKVCKGKVEFYVTNGYIVCGGDAKYHNAITSLSIDYTKDVNIIAKKIEKAIKSLIEFYSVEDVYQSVGTNANGDILIEIFQ